MTKSTERVWLNMPASGDKNDVRGFFGKQYDRLVGYLGARYADLSRMEVEDIVSDLMTDLISDVDLTGHVGNLSAYIYRSVQNRAIDYLRRRRKSVSLDYDALGEGGKKPAFSKEPVYDMHAVLDAEEIRRRIARALEKLSPDQRAVWVATEMDGFSFRELSGEWKQPIGTLLARKHRAVATLQRELSDLKQR